MRRVCRQSHNLSPFPKYDNTVNEICAEIRVHNLFNITFRSNKSDCIANLLDTTSVKPLIVEQLLFFFQCQYIFILIIYILLKLAHIAIGIMLEVVYIYPCLHVIFAAIVLETRAGLDIIFR